VADITRISLYPVIHSIWEKNLPASTSPLSSWYYLGPGDKSWPISLNRNDVYQLYAKVFNGWIQTFQHFCSFSPQSRRYWIVDGPAIRWESLHQSRSLKHHMEDICSWKLPGFPELCMINKLLWSLVTEHMELLL
jgi:hypothetical protein